MCGHSVHMSISSQAVTGWLLAVYARVQGWNTTGWLLLYLPRQLVHRCPGGRRSYHVLGWAPCVYLGQTVRTLRSDGHELLCVSMYLLVIIIIIIQVHKPIFYLQTHQLPEISAPGLGWWSYTINRNTASRHWTVQREGGEGGIIIMETVVLFHFIQWFLVSVRLRDATLMIRDVWHQICGARHYTDC